MAMLTNFVLESRPGVYLWISTNLLKIAANSRHSSMNISKGFLFIFYSLSFYKIIQVSIYLYFRTLVSFWLKTNERFYFFLQLILVFDV